MVTWSDLNGNLSITQVNSVGVDPNTPYNAFAGSMNNGVSQYTFTNLPTWSLVLPSALYNGGQVQFNQQNPSIVYAVSAEVNRIFNPNIYTPTLYRSTNFGAAGSWVNILQPGATLPVAAFFQSLFPFVVDPVHGSRVVVAAAAWSSPGWRHDVVALNRRFRSHSGIADQRAYTADRATRNPDQERTPTTPTRSMSRMTSCIHQDAGLTWKLATPAPPTFNGRIRRFQHHRRSDEP